MPNEKNSADPAICSAVSAARGSSIIVPTLCGIVDAALLLDLPRHRRDALAHQVELADRRDQRDHDLRAGRAARGDPVGRGLEDRPGPAW